MREMNETGYMHNRLRMIVSSFLIKTLLIDWRKGEKYFSQTSIIAEPITNTLIIMSPDEEYKHIYNMEKHSVVSLLYRMIILAQPILTKLLNLSIVRDRQSF